MKINNFTKCTLAIALGFGLNSLTVVEAADNTTGTTSETINKSFIEQFPFAEKFTDKDGITAVRMKSPDVPLVNKEKGYSKEIVRVINYKQGTKKQLLIEFINMLDSTVHLYTRFLKIPQSMMYQNTMVVLPLLILRYWKNQSLNLDINS